MLQLEPTQIIFWAAIFSGFVLVLFWYQFRILRKRLYKREYQMKQRMYELSILRELGERIGYSLNVQKIVDIISNSLGSLLPYSTVAYMIPQPDGRISFHINLRESISREFIEDVRKRMLTALSTIFGKNYDEKDIEESISGEITNPDSKEVVKSFFNIPIVINGKPAGIFTVASMREGLYKTSSEVEILYTIMNKASEAVSKLETVLEIEKGKLNSMVSSMADGVVMVDTANRLVVINPEAKQMLQLKQDNPTIFDVLDGLSDHIDLRTKIEESIKNDKLIIEDELQINNLFVQILITPVKDNKDQPLGAVVIFHDITKEKEVEKMREDFTSMMVHELRSPLTGIRSIADLLKKDTIKSEKEKYQEFVDLISSNSSSMLDLVNDLLDVAKLESGKFQVFKSPADITKVIKQRVESFASLAQQGEIELTAKITPSVPQSFAFDESKVSQVLNNLISNALKFTGAGGKVTVGAFYCKQSENLPQQAAAKDFQWPGMREGAVCKTDSVVVSVTDTGPGIPPEEISKLFNKFTQLSTSSKSEKKGTGLGLVIVKGITEAHGGEVGIFSEVGKGTTFYFTLPIDQKTGVATTEIKPK